jgi:GNAT superfamily N-acetyltransferase
MELIVRPLNALRRADFYRLHSAEHGADWCFCAAWHIPTWKGWSSWPAARNRQIREVLFARGEFDGYLLYDGDVPVGWCQAHPRDRLIRTRCLFHLPPDPDTWAVTCFFIIPARRRQGLAAHLLNEVLVDLKTRGAKRVEAYPKRLECPEAADLWNGPENLFRRAGFTLFREDPERFILVKELSDSSSANS